MLLAPHGGGFSVYASVCIAGDDRAGLERLLRYCARPPFAMERLHRKGHDHFLYHCPKPQSGGAAICGKQGDLILPPWEFIAKIAALVPPPRTHAPPSLLRRIAQPCTEFTVQGRRHCHGTHTGDTGNCS